MSWLTSAVPGAVGAVVGCVVGVMLTRTEAGAPKARAEVPSPRIEASSGIEESDDAELGALASRVRSLEQRVSLLTAALSVRRAEGRTDGAAEGTEGDLRGADVADPVFEAAVRDILERTDEEQRKERTERSERRAGRSAERAADRLGQELGLTDPQRQDLLELFKKHYRAMASLRDEDAEDRPATPGEWRSKVSSMRREMDEQIEQALTPAQLEKYRSIDNSEYLGGPRRRRPRQ